nr:hypothetical protein [uncultured Psychroserpens sp.]
MLKHLCLALLISMPVCAQNNSDWDKLIASAHAIGFCLYNTEEVFCDLHASRYDELEKKRNVEDEELHYFIMKEGWAKKRVADWAERQSLARETMVLFFDISQGFETDYGSIRHKPFGFFVVSLDDDLKFKVLKTYKKQAMSCAVFHESKPNILANILWREFMSGRLGLLDNNVEFLVYNEANIRKKFKVFKKRFFKYQKKVIN